MKVRPVKDATDASTPTTNTLLSTAVASRKQMSRPNTFSRNFPSQAHQSVQISLKSKLFPSLSAFTPLLSGLQNSGFPDRKPKTRSMRRNLPSSLSVREKSSVIYRSVSTLRHQDFTETADSVIFTCRSHIDSRSRRHMSQDLDKQEEQIKSSVKSILDVGTGHFQKFSAGRKNFWGEEEFYTRDQVRKMLSNVRQQLKKARHGMV